jgi:hypothetical protein
MATFVECLADESWRGRVTLYLQDPLFWIAIDRRPLNFLKLPTIYICTSYRAAEL